MGLPKGRTNNAKGRTKGSKNKKTLQWEALCESIIGKHAESFNAGLDDLMNSLDERKKLEGLKLYTQVLEYFKPKYSRIEHSSEEGKEPFKIIVPKDL